MNEKNFGYLKLLHESLVKLVISLFAGVCTSPLRRVGHHFLWTGSGGG